MFVFFKTGGGGTLNNFNCGLRYTFHFRYIPQLIEGLARYGPKHSESKIIRGI